MSAWKCRSQIIHMLLSTVFFHHFILFLCVSASPTSNFDHMTYKEAVIFWTDHHCVYPEPSFYKGDMNFKSVACKGDYYSHSLEEKEKFLEKICQGLFQTSAFLCLERNLESALTPDALSKNFDQSGVCDWLGNAQIFKKMKTDFGIDSDANETCTFCTEDTYVTPVCELLVSGMIQLFNNTDGSENENPNSNVVNIPGASDQNNAINPAAGENGPTNPAAGGNGPTNPAAGGNGATNPAAGGNGATNPAAGGNGATNPAAGGNGATNPAAGENGATNPAAGENGATSPAAAESTEGSNDADTHTMQTNGAGSETNSTAETDAGDTGGTNSKQPKGGSSKGNTKQPNGVMTIVYIMGIIVLILSGYIICLKRRKIMEYILAQTDESRRKKEDNKVCKYKKLDTKMEGMMPSLKETTGRNFIY